MAAEQALATSAPDIAARSLADPLEPELQRLRRGPLPGPAGGIPGRRGLGRLGLGVAP